MLQLLSGEFKKRQWDFVYLDGSTKNREEVVQQFQEDPNKSLFLISLKAGGTGLNLTAADYVFLYDPWWNEAVENQAINRAHRIGRKDVVIAKKYISVESIEEKILKLKSKKSLLADSLLDYETSQSDLSEEDFIYLIS
jgi:SNF2 family DNA or RNA helicase